MASVEGGSKARGTVARLSLRLGWAKSAMRQMRTFTPRPKSDARQTYRDITTFEQSPNLPEQG